MSYVGSLYDLSSFSQGRFNADLLGRIKNRVSDAVKEKMKVSDDCPVLMCLSSDRDFHINTSWLVFILMVLFTGEGGGR